MSLMVQSQMANDHNLIARAATAATMLGVEDARIWAQKNSLLLATQPGWVELYSEALAHEPPVDPAAWVPRVGEDPNVITDEMIIESVKKVLGITELLPDPPGETSEPWEVPDPEDTETTPPISEKEEEASEYPTEEPGNEHVPDDPGYDNDPESESDDPSSDPGIQLGEDEVPDENL